MMQSNFAQMLQSENPNHLLQRTENGAIGYSTTGKALLDLNFKVSSYRNRSAEEFIKDFEKAICEGTDLATVFLFFLRDVRGGLGERQSFRTGLRHLAITYPKHAEKLIGLVPEFGRWDDLWVLFDTPIEATLLSMVYDQLVKDWEALNQNQSASLLMKWMPSINTSSKISVKLAHKIAKFLALTPKQYRTLLSLGRKKLNVIETKMSANLWKEINYTLTPSKANLKYRKAFFKHDEEGYVKFIEEVKQGTKKLNAATISPYEIYAQYEDCRYDESFEQLWKSLQTQFHTDAPIVNTLVVVDGSGSMCSPIGNTNYSALDVSRSMGVFFAERNIGQFKDTIIEFSSRPKFIDFSNCTNLRQKIDYLKNFNDCSNTDMKAVFNLILATAIKNSVPQREMPETILILSDMEFDQGVSRMPLMKEVAAEYKANGYTLPKMVYWNICGSTDTIPMLENEQGVVLISGFSPSAIKMAVSQNFDPFQALLEVLYSERYKPVFEAMNM